VATHSTACTSTPVGAVSRSSTFAPLRFDRSEASNENVTSVPVALTEAEPSDAFWTPLS
jgi:hypothetical protein